jgi:adenosylcobinamide amidohydrolase/ABC-type Fe3+-hydroxamate transport system substrate-binding protein
MALAAALSLASASVLAAASFTDDAGEKLNFPSPPKRVVSLSPGATELICGIGAGKALAGITMDDTYFECLVGVPATGPAAKPDYDRVNALKPDLVIASPAQRADALAARGKNRHKILVYENPGDIESARKRMIAFGEIFGKKKEAAAALAESDELLETIALKVATLAPEQRRKAMRLRAGENGLFTGGKNSLDASFVRAAGGIPPDFGEGDRVPVTAENFSRFDPDFVFACGEDGEAIEAAFKTRGFSRVAAVKNRAISYFPCTLANRLSAHVGYFVGWLSTSMYPSEFGTPEHFARPNEILGETPLRVDKNLTQIKSAKTVEYRLFDFVHRSLIIEFRGPRDVVSTGDGRWEKVTFVGNSGSPPTVWGIHHAGGWESTEKTLFEVLNLTKENTSMIFTGADIRALAVKTKTHEDITVTAFVTAGADGNALRTSRDKGSWYDPGTINIIVVTNRSLLPGGAAGAAIVITEAKTAALWDMDIRSTETPRINPATGTGTDDIIVVPGDRGNPTDYVGGHGKIGELIAGAVYEGVTEALKKQNGKALNRPVWIRLDERGMAVEKLGPAFRGDGSYPDLANDLKLLMLEPRFAGFLESALSLVDAAQMGNLKDPGAFESLALTIASEIAGKPADSLMNLATEKDLPPLLKTAFDALATGLTIKNRG